MTTLPSGTVTLLFSDVEGSTLLLGRLGAAYAQAVDGQRRVQRAAWAAHGGVELGTEGDSFYVVFPTAEGAVKAAAQAQRELAGCSWPGEERVRVRMGIHTGAPTPHDGAYVGMDVHRAARIAAAAHGGQVVISEATAKLLTGCQPDEVGIRDLGSHQLKDIAHAEHLFQLAIEGLPSQFPPLRSLGAASSLPRPATPLVGRDDELTALTALLSSPQVRLVTLTGPGGSGKTRLAIALAHALIQHFPAGVYFTALAAVTTADVLWTSIAEVLDAPAESRTPPRLFDFLAHLQVLLVLDNLEQVSGADDVVARLLEVAPQLVVVASSRRALSVPGEHTHPVPPLDLPDTITPEDAAAASALQLFVQHAQMVRPDFRLSARNTADVVQVCRALDGLPLAIELAAARTRLLSPKAMLARLDKALDIASTSSQAPTRQKTMRRAIAWSYDLLSNQQKAFFARVGVFGGGADLDAITTVTADILDEVDPLDLVAELVDASLAFITEGLDGEPRIGLLATIRSFAQSVLTEAGVLDDVRRSHALHYLSLAQALQPLRSVAGERRLEARGLFEIELDNFREALNWSLGSNGSADEATASERVQIGLQLCDHLDPMWRDGGYYAEDRRWLERAVSLTGGGPGTPELGRCLTALAAVTRISGDWDRSRDAATRSVAILRQLDDKRSMWHAIVALGRAASALGDLQGERDAYEEAFTLAREIDDKHRLAEAMLELAKLEAAEHNFERALELDSTAADILFALDDEQGALRARHNTACALRELGRLAEAERLMHSGIPALLRLADPESRIGVAEDYGAVLAALGDHQRATRLLGAADAMHERIGVPRHPGQTADIETPFAHARSSMSRETWDAAYQRGRAMTVEDALTEAHAANV